MAGTVMNHCSLVLPKLDQSSTMAQDAGDKDDDCCCKKCLGLIENPIACVHPSVEPWIVMGLTAGKESGKRIGRCVNHCETQPKQGLLIAENYVGDLFLKDIR